MPFIRESVVVTTAPDGTPHVAPLGVIEEGESLVIAPFEPSRTLANLRTTGRATINYLVDARIFAGLVSGRQREWPLLATPSGGGHRLADALAHDEVAVVEVKEDPERPRFHCRTIGTFTHRPFLGMNRAQAAVLEAAILCTRLSMLPPEKIDREMAYLGIAIGKTAGDAEREAWGWLTAMIDAHRRKEGLA